MTRFISCRPCLFLASFSLLLTAVVSCQKNSGQAPAHKVKADFTFTTSDQETLPCTVQFTDGSINATSLRWNLANGTTAVIPNPQANYSQPGRYNVTLTASNKAGSESITKPVKISPYDQPYTSFDKASLNLFGWEGTKVVILSRQSQLNRATMFKWVKAMDTAYSYYKKITGREPANHPATYIGNRTTIADVGATCGAGCGYLGATGIELQNNFFDIMYNAIHNRDEYDQVAFYELGRNFWFYGNQLAYKTNDPVTTGYAVFMRFMSMEAAGIQGAPFGSWSFANFRQNVENLIDTYAASPSLTWENTLGAGKGVPGSGLGATDLFASFCFRLRRDFGGEGFVQNVWKIAGELPTANTTQDAVDNFFLASCAAGNKNLTALFRSWRWPLSAAAVAAAGKFP